MTDSLDIRRGDIFHFDGLPGSPRGEDGHLVGHFAGLDARAIGVLVKVDSITWTGELHVVRGHRDPANGNLVFPEYHFSTGGQVGLADARTMLAAGVWRRYRH